MFFALPRIERQRDETTGVRQNAIPRQGIAFGPESPQRGQKRRALALLASTTGDSRWPSALRRGGLLDRVQQYRMRPELDEDRYLGVEQPAHRIRESHRLTQVAAPIGGAELAAFSASAE